MEDRFLHLFAWLAPFLERASVAELPIDQTERAVLDEFTSGWGKTDTASLLRGLSQKYGEMAAQTIEKVLAHYIKSDWAETGAREAHPGAEIADFIRILWEPLKNEGFGFTFKTVDAATIFAVTKCPVYELAISTGLTEWCYHLACATDFYSTCAFSSKIGFNRTKTLMQGDECCNHTYFPKEAPETT
jgi:predicted ArsR family transcriptional regulator